MRDGVFVSRGTAVKPSGRKLGTISPITIPGPLALVVALLAVAFPAMVPGAAMGQGISSSAANGAGNCSSYQCFYYADDFLRSAPDPEPGQVATVPLATRVVGAASATNSMLVGLDNGPWSFWNVSDGIAQGRSGLIGGLSAGNVYNFGYWQYVDALYYYLHDTVSVPPTQWVNAGHRNGVPVLGTITGDCTDSHGQPLCAPQATELFSPDNYRLTVARLYQYATAYGFDGWMIDMEAGFDPSPSVLSAVQLLSRLRLPDGQLIRVAVYEGGEQALKPTGMLPYFMAGALWQSDYGSFAPPPVYPATSYDTLAESHLASQNLRAYWSSYVYDFQRGCPDGDQTTDSQIWNGNGGSSAKCLDTAALFRNQRATIPQSPEPGTPAVYTASGLFAPVWTYFGNLTDGSPVSRTNAQAADEALWVGADVGYSGPSCVRSGTNNAVSALITPRSVVGTLPFVTNFNEGEGDVYDVEGQLVATAPWNNLSAQDVLPTWYCTQGGDLTTTPTYATAADGGAFNGGSALSLSGHSGEVELYNASIPVSSWSQPTLAFVSKTLTGAPPYVRVSYSDGTSDVVPATTPGPGWQQTISPLRAQGKTITAISVGVAGTGASVDSTLGELRIYDARTDVTPAPISITSANSVISWPSSQEVAPSYWNVYADTGGCLRFLGPAFTNHYDVTQPMFASGQATTRYVIQPVLATGSVAAIPPACAPGP